MPDPSIRLAAVGDIDLSRDAARAAGERGAGWPFEHLRPHLAGADLRFGNMESVILPPDYPDERIDPDGLVGRFDASASLAAAGFDIVNLAQNHVLDAGTAGMFHTRDRIEAAGVAAAGVGRSQPEARRMRVLTAGGLRVGFLCYAEDSNYTLGTTGPCGARYTPGNVLADLAENAGRADVLVVSVHADLEFTDTPSPARREAFRRFAAAGAALVLGHHPHVPQGVERVGRGLVAYSLGNCVFDAHTSEYMRSHGPHTGQSFLLNVELSPAGAGDFERVGFRIDPPPEQRPRPLAGREAEALLARLDELDRAVVDDETVAANWRRAALRHLDIYLERLRGMGREEVIDDLLGRLLLVAENRSWVEEVFRVVRQRWSARADAPCPYNRPHRLLRRRFEDRPGD